MSAFVGCNMFFALSLACTGVSNPPNGEGGSSSAAPAGAAGMNTAGFEGNPDSGAAGGEAVDAGLDASESSSGSGGRAPPPGCPEPTPTPATLDQNVVIQS